MAGQFNPYASGRKHYGGGRSAPNVGPVRDKSGYVERDIKLKARRDALTKRLMKGPRRIF